MEDAAATQSSLQQELVRGNPLIAGKFAGGNDFQASIPLGAMTCDTGGLLGVMAFLPFCCHREMLNHAAPCAAHWAGFPHRNLVVPTVDHDPVAGSAVVVTIVSFLCR